MKDRQGKLIIKDKNGKEKEYSTLATFRYGGKYFILYTDYSKDEKRRIKVYASLYNPDDETNKVEKIQNEKDIEFIETYVKKLEEDLESKMKLM